MRILRYLKSHIKQNGHSRNKGLHTLHKRASLHQSKRTCKVLALSIGDVGLRPRISIFLGEAKVDSENNGHFLAPTD